MKHIYLRALGTDISDLLAKVAPRLTDVFGMGVCILPPIDLLEAAYNSARGQYLSSAMLLLLEQNLPADALRVLGVASVDLYVPHLNFVFGEAKLDGPSGVISIFRLRPEFYDEKPDPQLLLRRMEVEAIHELGHTFGIKHCPRETCVMHFSNSIAQTDVKGPGFCAGCSAVMKETVQREAAEFTRSGGFEL